MLKTYLEGTHRTQSPEDTWSKIQPLLRSYGVTRVADVTGMDDIGISVTVAVRPLGRTLSVAQGKGTTLAAARVSGAMEAIEVWHGEHAVPKAALRGPAESANAPYPIAALESHPGSLVTPRTVLDWITATSLADDTLVHVPRASVVLGRHRHSKWRLHLPSSSTNGLASGNTRAEAICHGLCELIERDVISDLRTRGQASDAERIAPETVTGPECAALLDKLTRARVWFELWHLPNRFGVPVAVCYLWREDQPTLLVSGSGAHVDPAVALSRAITEAAQTRLTQIVGTREDINPLAYRAGPSARPRHDPAPAVSWDEIARRFTAFHATDDEEAAYLIKLVTDHAGHSPLAVELTRGRHARHGLHVVKVLAPHLRYTARHTIPRPNLEVAA
ncbi:YcaO-like family protein [Streptomycetaceae bacterium NBC_01309]